MKSNIQLCNENTSKNLSQIKPMRELTKELEYYPRSIIMHEI
jgi:hypothetical protein